MSRILDNLSEPMVFHLVNGVQKITVPLFILAPYAMVYFSTTPKNTNALSERHSKASLRMSEDHGDHTHTLICFIGLIASLHITGCSCDGEITLTLARACAEELWDLESS